jgi:hypothetical protein
VLLTPLYLWAARPQPGPARAESGPDWALLITSTAAAFFVYGVSMSAWGQFTIARLRLAARRQLPLQVMGFLDDAHRRGVLRQTGGAYVFRHSRVQDTLRKGGTESEGEGPKIARGALPRRAERRTTGAAAFGAIGVTVFWLAFVPLYIAASTPGDDRYLSVPHPCAVVDRGTAERALPGEVRLLYRSKPVPLGSFARNSERCVWSSTVDFDQLDYEVTRFTTVMQQSGLRQAQQEFADRIEAWTSKDTEVLPHAHLAPNADESALLRRKVASYARPTYTVLARSANLIVSLEYRRTGATSDEAVRLARDLLQRTLKGAESCDTSTSVCD